MLLNKNYIIEGNKILSGTKYQLQETIHEFDFLYIDLQKVLNKEYLESWFNFTSVIPKEWVYHAPNDDCNNYGIETNLHISLIYGIQPSEYNYKLVKQYFDRNKRCITVQFKNISYFTREDKPYEVLKFDIESEGLQLIYNELSEILNINNSSMSTQNGYKPHATIAYLIKDEHFFVGKGLRTPWEYEETCPFLNKEFEVKELSYQDYLDTTTIIYI
jgi:2'-5' RNA ligase